MLSTVLKVVRAAGAIVLALLMLLFGCLVTAGGYQILRRWSYIGPWYAACGLVWIVAGPAMTAGGLWVLGTLGRNRVPLWAGGVAAVLSGGSLVAGVLTYVIPCSGPS